MSLKRYYYLFFFVLTSFHSFSQMPGVCNPANREKGWGEGAFEIVGDLKEGCSPLNIQVVDKSDGVNVAYDFNYTGGGLNTSSNTSVTLETEDEPKVFTILQYASKNGKILISCKQVKVSPPIRYSISTCDTDIQINFPKQSDLNNQTIKYKINGGTEQSIAANQFPFTSPRIAINYPLDVEVFAVNQNGSRTCNPPKETINNRYDNRSLTKITELEVLENNKVKIKIEGSYNTAPHHVQLHRAAAHQDIFTQYTPISNIQVGTNIIDLPDASKSFCFRAFREEVCGSTDQTTEVCTIPIELIPQNETQNAIHWMAHKPQAALSGVSRKIYTQLEIKPKNEPSFTINAANSPYIHNIDCKKEYCYQINSTVDDRYGVKQQTAISKSLKQCFSRKEIKAPALNDLFVTVNNDFSEINFQDNSTWNLDKSMFYLYDSPKQQKLDSLPTKGTFKYSAKDPKQESLCFKVAYVDKCGSPSELSPEICTIHLSNQDLNLHWSSSNPFSPNSIREYTLENQGLPSILNTYPPNIFDHTLVLDTEDEEMYVIKSIDNLGNISYSNSVAISPKYFIKFPTVFSPNGDSKNDTFKAFGRISSVQDFNFALYDRWSNKILEYTRPDFEWNGTINNQKVPPGTYIYAYNGVFKNGETFSFSNVLVVL